LSKPAREAAAICIIRSSKHRDELLSGVDGDITITASGIKGLSHI